MFQVEIDRLKQMTTAQLQNRLKSAEEFTEKHSGFTVGHYNEYLQYLKMLIASRIGK